MTFSHFKQGRLEPINFDLVQCNNLDLQRSMICEFITTEFTISHYAYYENLAP
jgi:hypothetical protein